MEAVGGIASIITLIEATGVLIKVSKRLISRWENAPHEIKALSTRLSLLAADLQSIKNATSTSHPVLTDAIIRQSLSDLLTDVRKRLMKLESLHSCLEQHKPIRQRIRWTMKDASSVEKMLIKTQELEQRLANMMILITLKAQAPILDGLDRIERMVATIAVPLPTSAQAASATTTTTTTLTMSSNTAQYIRPTAAGRRILASTVLLLDKSWEPWGLRGSQVTTKYASHLDCKVNFSVAIPFARILGRYAFTGCLSFQTTPLCWGSMTFRHPCYFAVARVVDRDHSFMRACRDGDVETVALMLRSGAGRPTDMTVEGSTPMFLAVCYSHTRVITELLNCGTDLDAMANASTMVTALEVASTMKNLDVVRFLLQRGASTDCRSATGFRLSALCWRQSDYATKHPSMDIFKLFDEGVSLDQESADPKQPVVLGLAAVSAFDSQIDQLIGLGADAHWGEEYGRAPIHIAAFHGNCSTYSALVSHYDHTFFEGSHQMGSYLLYLVLTGKAEQFARTQESCHSWLDPPRHYRHIASDLLRRGVDPTAPLNLPPEGLYHGSPNLRDLNLNMNGLAATLGPETETWYLSVLDGSGSCSIRQNIDVLCESTTATARHSTPRLIHGCVEKLDHTDLEIWTESSERGDSGVDGSSVESSPAGPENGSVESADSQGEQFWDANEIV